jgi:hypothetical protein
MNQLEDQVSNIDRILTGLYFEVFFKNNFAYFQFAP